jgi:hypothetical protein
MLDSIDQMQEMLIRPPEIQRTGKRWLQDQAHSELANGSGSIKPFLFRSPGEEESLQPERKQHTRPRGDAKAARMATDLDYQLRNMYASPPLLVSVDSYKEPSLESSPKASEKICKEIETQSRKL